MGEKLHEKRGIPNESIPNNQSESVEEPLEYIDQGKAFALITKSFMTIAASMDAFAFLAEKWALREGLVTEKELE